MTEQVQARIADYRNLLSFDGRGFIILGAGDGIGAEISHALAQCGARLFCVDRDPERAAAIARTTGGHDWPADVTVRAELEAAFAEAQARLGAINGVINIIGVGRVKAITDYNDAELDWQFDIVLRHALMTVQLAANAVADNGSVTLVGSLSGNAAVRKTLVYGVAKAGLHHLVRHAAVELGERGIRVNGVAPGYIRTPRHIEMLPEEGWEKLSRAIPLGQAGEPREIASALLFLCSDLASHVTGVMLPVDGGLGIVAATPDLQYRTPPAAG